MTKCYLLGAGASYGHDPSLSHEDRPPLAKDLFKVGWERGILKDDDFDVLVKQILKENELEKSLDDVVAEDLEITDPEAFLGELVNLFNNREEEVAFDEYAASISLTYYYLYELFRQHLSDYQPSGDNYDQLAEHLKGSSDAVLTLNYDTLLEKAFESNHIGYTTPNGRNPNGVDLIKLHGSVSWNSKSAVTITGDHPFPYRVQNVHSNRIDGPIEFFTNYWIESLSYRALVDGYRDTREPGIIPPLSGYKDYQKLTVYQTQWNIASQLLEEATEVVIIGCSLNPEDDQLRELLKESVTDDTLFTAVTPHPENIVEEIEDIFKSRREIEEIGGDEPFSNYIETAL